jgi:hypothetical protein
VKIKTDGISSFVGEQKHKNILVEKLKRNELSNPVEQISQPLTEHVGSLPSSQELVNGPCPEKMEWISKR